MGLGEKGWRHVFLLFAFTLLIPIPFTYQSKAHKEPFDPSPIFKLDAEKPDCVFVGNSYLQYAVDPKLLSETVPGTKASIIFQPGSSMTFWYLVFKNLILQSRQRPKHIMIFFMDSDLTDMYHWHVESTIRKQIDGVSLDEEPKLDELTEPKTLVEHARYWCSRFFSNERIRELANDNLDFVALGMSLVPWQNTYEFKGRTTQLFSISNLRSDLTRPPTLELSSRQKFLFRLQRSLLPEVMRLSHESGIQVVFVRMRRRPPKGLDSLPVSKNLEEYISELSSYLKQENAVLLDFSSSSELTEQLFGDGDHFNSLGQIKFTHLLSERLKELDR